MKKSILVLGMLMLTAGSSVLWQSCKKKSDDKVGSTATGYALSIQSGARSVDPGQTLNYSAVLVDVNGNVTTPANVSWSVSNSLGSFSGGTFTPSNLGSGTITATATVNGATLTAKVPVGVYLPAVFTVVPSAIIWSTNSGTIGLINVYLGTGSISNYSYTSTNSGIASVDGSGIVTFHATGECIITVTANGITGNNKVNIPVLVVGAPTITLPVTRVTVNPAGIDLFRGETATLAAKAFNGSNAEVSSSFTWVSQDPSIATVDASGKVTALQLGNTVITAAANGIVGQAEVQVLPDTTLIVTPFMASISPGGTKQFTAQAYSVNHTSKALSAIAMPAGLTWMVPITGIPIFDIATVNSTGLVTMSSSATMGLSTVVLASVASPTIGEGGALVMVSDCNCGTTTPGVTNITVSTGATLSLSLTGGPSVVSAQALDAGNNPVSGATITMCSDNIAVCAVDSSSGSLIPTSPGTAVITLCNGSVQTTITVTVTL